MLFTGFFFNKETQLILCRIQLCLLARSSTIFSVSYVALWKKKLPTPGLKKSISGSLLVMSRLSFRLSCRANTVRLPAEPLLSIPK